MKNYNVIYNKGHLVNAETGKRLLLKRGKRFSIQGDNDSFEEEDELTKLHEKALDRDEKLEKLDYNFRNHKFYPVAKAGDYLAFSISIRHQTDEDNTKTYWFNAEILEDLYMKKNLNSKDQKISLAPCLVKTVDCFRGDINLYEDIYGFSLNNLFSNMVAFYFMLQRSGACNAFRTFQILSHKAESYDDYQRIKKMSLEDIRKEMMKFT